MDFDLIFHLPSVNFIRRQIEEIFFLEFLWLTWEWTMVVSPKLHLLGQKQSVKWGAKAIIVLALISAGDEDYCLASSAHFFFDVYVRIS